MAELVVIPAFARLGEHIVRFLRFLEPFLSLLVVLVDVRVILANKFSMRFLDLVFARVARHPKNFIVVALGHRDTIVAVAASCGTAAKEQPWPTKRVRCRRA